MSFPPFVVLKSGASTAAHLSRTRPPTRPRPTRSPLEPQRRYASTVPPRSQSFNAPTSAHVRHLRSLLPSPNSLASTLDGSASSDDLAKYNNDWLDKFHGKSEVLLKPRSTEEISRVTKYCYEHGLAIVPQGGNTGLVGTSTPWPQ